MDSQILMFVLEFVQPICMLTTLLKNVLTLTTAQEQTMPGLILFQNTVSQDVPQNLSTLD